MGEIVSYEPAAPNRTVGRVLLADAPAIESALSAAADRQSSWAGSSADRSNALTAWGSAIEAEAGRLAELVAREVGKPIREARAEVARTVSILRYYAQAPFEPDGEDYGSGRGVAGVRVRAHPLGTVLAITPWNFPVAIPVWKLAPALAYGNTAILRPSSAASVTAWRLGEIAREALPEGTLAVLSTSVQRVAGLIDDPRINAVSFTGSTSTGEEIIHRCVARRTPVQAEMGGQNPCIILDDADLDLAAADGVNAAMHFAGQKCTATSRFIVLRAVADAFVGRISRECTSLDVGDPLDEATSVGPVISEEARSSVADAIRGAVSRGGRVVVGGKALDRQGWYMQPTLIALDDARDPLAQTETFGPVATVHIVSDEAEAVQLANATPYGLVASVYGRDLARAAQVAEGVDAGMLRINTPTTGVDYFTPFGGERLSSFGLRELGKAAKAFYTKTRTVQIRG